MKKILDQILNAMAIFAMAFFAIPKLLAKPQSIAGFQQFEKAIGVDADFFRLFTGVSELAMAAMILVFAIQGNKTVGKLAFSFLLITMITALGLEFFARPEPKMILVIIATLLAAISIYKLNAKTQ
ncbi:DoxX family protein [Reichenbachiella sp. MSK19-1]|uniref:DoxX family protein n=1 Tax=Reichenbachiella sp. MSK19-1 TaxID=1897631 RepID=UPI000E6B6938|nr:DoxX family protein [Reichenbachiella sp. MSK19-1]RJE74351.1 hypothetical protein BGP76_14385 [Reichenbachiella sp. MSK19-1]